MVDIVANGTDGEDNIQSGFWRYEDHVFSNMGAMNDFFAGWSAHYTVNGEDGNDHIVAGYAGGVASGGAGNDQFDTRGRWPDEELPAPTHILSGDDGDDTFFVWGGAQVGTVTVSGGADVDQFRDFRSLGADSFDGGDGFDWVEIGSNGGAVAVTLGVGGSGGFADNSTYRNTEGVYATSHGDVVNGDSLNNVIIGNQGADTISGGAGNDLLIGRYLGQYFMEAFTATRNQVGAANPFSYTESSAINRDAGVEDDGASDSLDGGTGNDVLYGGWGPDTLNGGGGRDLASFRDSNTAVQVNLAANTGAGGTAEGDSYISIEDLHGSDFNDTLTGKAGANALFGREGNDTLDGGEGADTMTGGTWDDTFYVSESGDKTIELEGQGTDTVYSAVARKLGANLENLILQGTANTKGLGNELANQLAGNTGNNLLEGYDANDTLTGNEGDDTMNGGAGIDSMNGGAGNDVYYVRETGDQTTEDLAGTAGGIDTVFSNVERTLGANLEHLRLQGTEDINGTGNELNNKVFGTIGANLLQGLAGNDTLQGKDGADTLVGGEGNDTMSGGSQADVFRFTTTLAGADVITDFSRNADRFDLGGGSFSQATVNGTDTILRHDGGTIRIQGVNNLTLAQWNGLVLPSGLGAQSDLQDTLGLAGRMHSLDLHVGHGDWLA